MGDSERPGTPRSSEPGTPVGEEDGAPAEETPLVHKRTAELRERALSNSTKRASQDGDNDPPKRMSRSDRTESITSKKLSRNASVDLPEGNTKPAQNFKRASGKSQDSKMGSRTSSKRDSGRSIDSKIAARKLQEKEAEPDPEIAAAKARQLVRERRLLFMVTGVVGIAAIIWIISISTQYWFVVAAPTEEGLFMANYSRHFLYSRSGLFSICRFSRRNGTMLSICRKHEMFPSPESYDNKILDKNIINYTRTELFFSIVSLLFMVMGAMFSTYTFRNPRYMFKRLAAGIHFLSASSVMVVIEVVINSIYYEKEKLHYVHPPGSIYYYHYSFYLAWAVFLLNAMASITFLIYSKKRKRDKALSEEMAMADEPTIIGR